MGGAYGVNIYQDFPHGEFKFLDRKWVYAENREEAKKKVLEIAKEQYKDMDISVTNAN